MVLPNWVGSNGKGIVLIIGFAVATELVWRVYKKYASYNKKKQDSIEISKPIADVLFFSEQSALCRIHVNYSTPCSLSTCPVANLNKIVSYLSTATRTLDVCVYFLTFNTIVKTILELQRRDVVIRVITDDESSDNDASQIYNMRKAGIQVQSGKSQYLMHHKFAIVDRKILITGSANWTMQAFFGNCENMLITNHSEFVTAFVNQFEQLWLKYTNDFNTKKENGTL